MNDVSKFLKNLSKSLDITISDMKDIETMKIDVISTGSYTLDAALGVGGYPRGRLVEVFGKEASGKTLLSLLAIAEAQKNGGKAAFIDMEHAFDPFWASKHGVDVDNLTFVQPDYGEQALQIAEQMIISKLYDIIVIDSTAALIPKQELDATMEQQSMGLQARMMSKGCRKLTAHLGTQSRTVVLFINQIRADLMVKYGNPETTSGGKALKFYSSVRLKVGRVSGSEEKNSKKEVVGHVVKVKVEKNKVAPPFKEATFALNYYTGVDRVNELIDIGLATGKISQNVSIYKYEDNSWKGRDAVVEAFKADEKMQIRLLESVKASNIKDPEPTEESK